MKLGTVTIGQSPRSDIIPELTSAIGYPVEVIERGALDGLSREQIGALAPADGDNLLVSRLRDGTEVRLAERHVMQRLTGGIRELENEGVDLIILLCTGEFPDLSSSCPILKPDRLLSHIIPGIIERGTLGAIVPEPEQQETMRPKWERTGLAVVSAAASPYRGSDSDIAAAARTVRQNGADLIVLDCLGFGRLHAQIAREQSGLPVILPRSVLGRIAGELLQ